LNSITFTNSDAFAFISDNLKNAFPLAVMIAGSRAELELIYFNILRYSGASEERPASRTSVMID